MRGGDLIVLHFYQQEEEEGSLTVHQAKGIEPRGIEEGNNTRVCVARSLSYADQSARVDGEPSLIEHERNVCLPVTGWCR